MPDPQQDAISQLAGQSEVSATDLVSALRATGVGWMKTAQDKDVLSDFFGGGYNSFPAWQQAAKNPNLNIIDDLGIKRPTAPKVTASPSTTPPPTAQDPTNIGPQRQVATTPPPPSPRATWQPHTEAAPSSIWDASPLRAMQDLLAPPVTYSTPPPTPTTGWPALAHQLIGTEGQVAPYNLPVRIARGIGAAAGEGLEDVTKQGNLLSLGSMMALGPIGEVYPTLRSGLPIMEGALGSVFRGQMLSSAINKIPGFAKAVQNNDWETATKLAATGIVEGTLAAGEGAVNKASDLLGRLWRGNKGSEVIAPKKSVTITPAAQTTPATPEAVTPAPAKYTAPAPAPAKQVLPQLDETMLGKQVYQGNDKTTPIVFEHPADEAARGALTDPRYAQALKDAYGVSDQRIEIEGKRVNSWIRNKMLNDPPPAGESLNVPSTFTAPNGNDVFTGSRWKPVKGFTGPTAAPAAIPETVEQVAKPGTQAPGDVDATAPETPAPKPGKKAKVPATAAPDTEPASPEQPAVVQPAAPVPVKPTAASVKPQATSPANWMPAKGEQIVDKTSGEVFTYDGKGVLGHRLLDQYGDTSYEKYDKDDEFRKAYGQAKPATLPVPESKAATPVAPTAAPPPTVAAPVAVTREAVAQRAATSYISDITKKGKFPYSFNTDTGGKITVNGPEDIPVATKALQDSIVQNPTDTKMFSEAPNEGGLKGERPLGGYESDLKREAAAAPPPTVEAPAAKPTAVDAVRARLKAAQQRGERGSVPLGDKPIEDDPYPASQMFKDIYSVGKDMIARTGTKFQDWAKGMTDNYGSSVTPYLSDVWKSSQPAKPWYSQLERVIQEKMPNAASAEQVRGIVTNPNAGVKDSELKWTGLDDLLKQGGKLTKQQVLDKLAERRIQVNEAGGGGKFAKYQLPGGPLSRDTEILTDAGWKRIDSISVGDVVLTRKDLDGELEWQPVEATPSVFSEKMYHFKNQSIDMVVTPGHTMVIKRRRRSSRGIMRVKAEELWKMSECVIPLTGKWDCEGSHQLFGLDSEDVAEFIGWYIAEGSYQKSRLGTKTTIQIAQSKDANPGKCDRLEKLMSRLGLSWKYYGGGYGVGVRSMPIELKELLHAQPTSGDKYIPALFFKESRAVIVALLRGLVLGDGCISPPKNNRLKRINYFTKSKRLAGGVQALALLAGNRASVRMRPSGLYDVSLNYKEWNSVDDAKHAIVDYNDYAFCVTVRNHAIYVRRNGIAAFTGNSNYKEVLLTLPPKPEESSWTSVGNDTGFHSSHWDEPNVVAHLRMNDRVDPDTGKKMLFLEELQSDWANQTRSNERLPEDQVKAMRDRLGYINNRTEAIMEKTYKAADRARGFGNAGLYKEWAGPNEANGNFEDFVQQRLYPEEAKEYDALNNEGADITEKLQKHEAAPPDFPFAKNWHELALKRALRLAGEGGYDSIGFTTGAQQADRYSLRRHISQIDYRKEPDGRYRLGVVDKNGGAVPTSLNGYNENELPGVLGREVAQQIINGEGKPGGGRMTLYPQDLSLGGKGKDAFYDTILPSFANKLGKKFGAKVEEGQIETGKINLENNQQLGDTLRALKSLNNLGYSTSSGALDAVLRDPEWKNHYDIRDNDSDLADTIDKYIKASRGTEKIHKLVIPHEMKRHILERGQSISRAIPPTIQPQGAAVNV